MLGLIVLGLIVLGLIVLGLIVLGLIVLGLIVLGLIVLGLIGRTLRPAVGLLLVLFCMQRAVGWAGSLGSLGANCERIEMSRTGSRR